MVSNVVISIWDTLKKRTKRPLKERVPRFDQLKLMMGTLAEFCQINVIYE